MRQKIEGLKDFSSFYADLDRIELLKGIKAIVFHFQSQKFKCHGLHEAKKRFLGCYQRQGMTMVAYLESFHNIVNVVEHCGGDIGTDSGIIEEQAADDGVDMSTASRADKDGDK
jgi:hypothetical protein